MNRRFSLLCVGIFALAIAACGDDTAKSNKVAENAATNDMAGGDMGGPGDDSGNNVTPNNVTPNNVTPNNITPNNNPLPDMGGGDMGGGDDMGSADMGDDVTINPALCGNAMLDPGEDCDDANMDDTDECNSDCTFTCGDGIVGPAEQCDIAIAAGAGSCPTTCDDGNDCTSDTLQGSECQAQCVTGDITACTDGDSCCPMTCNANTDMDCQAVCGNGVLEGTETCDGNCPADCDDNVACTTDVMAGTAATCDVMCTNTMITTCVDADGCCPPVCDPTNDTDCSNTCGNNTIEPPELCDGNCPTSNADCDDSDMCTADTVSGSAAACTAQCVNTPLGCSPNLNDGCCPMMCNANTDGDCQAVCGNGVVEMGEQCDDMNTMPGDGCDASCLSEGTSVAFRMSDLDLMDPHVFLGFLGCRDITNGNVPLNLSPPINGLLQNAITLDEDNDGLLDLSFVAIFTPLDQSNGGTGSVTVAEADCTAPIGTTTCTVDSQGATFQTATYTTDTVNDCLDALMNTTRPYTPVVLASTPPCFMSTTIDLTIDISGILVPLTDVQVGATYVGNPATGLSNGLLRGFISEADADQVLLPGNLPLIGGDPLSSVLAGGNGACPNHDDRDLGPDGQTMGWWFYLNFPATQVAVTVN